MVVRASPPRGDHAGRLEALVFQQALPPVYSLDYPEPGKVVPRLKRELNAFLATWSGTSRRRGISWSLRASGVALNRGQSLDPA